MDNGGCDHYCTETIQSYICSCYPGYTLDTDHHMCVGKSSSIMIIIRKYGSTFYIGIAMVL